MRRYSAWNRVPLSKERSRRRLSTRENLYLKCVDRDELKEL